MSNAYTQATPPAHYGAPYGGQQQPGTPQGNPYQTPPANAQPGFYPAQPPQPYLGEKGAPQPSPYGQPMAQQPQAIQGMTVSAGGNRNVKNLPEGPQGREWSNGLCSCCEDAGTCILAWCCPCVVYAQNKQRLQYLNSRGIPDPDHGGGFCSGDCWLHGLITGCFGAGWVLQMANRSAIRARYRIQGGGCGDCCSAFCCTPCELTQESRELELEESSFRH